MEKNDVAGDILDWIDERFVKSFARIHCLALIARGHQHGYEIMRFIETTYGVKVSTGHYYPVLQWLEDNGYIAGDWEHTEGKPGKKMYSVTPRGEKLLAKAKKRMHYLINDVFGKAVTEV